VVWFLNSCQSKHEHNKPSKILKRMFEFLRDTEVSGRPGMGFCWEGNNNSHINYILTILLNYENVS